MSRTPTAITHPCPVGFAADASSSSTAQASGPSRRRHTRLEARLGDYWAEAVLDAARDGHPAAYGKSHLVSARQTIIDHIERLAEASPADRARQPTDGLGDPLRALADLDRAIKRAAAQPSLRLVEPPTHRWPQRGLGVDMHQQHLVHQQHSAYEQLYPSEPSAGIELF